MLRLLGEQRVDEAATEYARYVLDVRDSFEVCNARLRAVRQYIDDMAADVEQSGQRGM